MSGKGIGLMFLALCMCGAAVADPALRTDWWLVAVIVVWLIGIVL